MGLRVSTQALAPFESGDGKHIRNYKKTPCTTGSALEVEHHVMSFLKVCFMFKLVMSKSSLRIFKLLLVVWLRETTSHGIMLFSHVSDVSKRLS